MLAKVFVVLLLVAGIAGADTLVLHTGEVLEGDQGGWMTLGGRRILYFKLDGGGSRSVPEADISTINGVMVVPQAPIESPVAPEAVAPEPASEEAVVPPPPDEEPIVLEPLVPDDPGLPVALESITPAETPAEEPAVITTPVEEGTVSEVEPEVTAEITEPMVVTPLASVPSLPALPTLEMTLLGMLPALATPPVRAGIVAEVGEAGDTATIDLGWRDNVTQGMEFEVVATVRPVTHPETGALIREDREIIARLRAETVEEGASVCRVIEGVPTVKNAAGELCQVLAVGQGPRKVAVGTVRTGGSWPVPTTLVREALEVALGKTQAFLRTAPEEAECLLHAEVVGLEGAWNLVLTLADVATGTVLGSVPGLHPVAWNAAALGYVSAITADLETPLNLAAVRVALETQFGLVHEGAGVLMVPAAGDASLSIWISTEGRVTVAGRYSTADSAYLSTLESVWQTAAAAARDVTAALKTRYEGDLLPVLWERGVYYTPLEGQQQRTYVRAPGAWDGWILHWPQAGVAWAFLAEAPSDERSIINLNGGRLLSSNWNGYRVADIRMLPFGTHLLSGAGYGRERRFIIDAWFPSPGEPVLLTDANGLSMATRQTHSLPIGTLVLPGLEESASTPAS